MKKILIIDDEKSICQILSYVLEERGYKTRTAQTGADALQILKDECFDLVVQDLKLPDIEGLDLLKKIKNLYPELIIIVITAFSNWQIAVEAMRLGAFNYIRKPFDNENIVNIVRRGIHQRELAVADREKDSKIIGNSLQMQKLKSLIQRVAPTDATILIHGESGVGKELVARAIHNFSSRQEQVFISINCGSLVENLLESELFGHVQGAFTGAIQSKKGLVEVANSGSLFLDEVGEMLLSTQVKLLRVLENREFMPIGGVKAKKTDVRFITATNRNLQEMVKRGEFREDLFYRLNVIPIEVPSLRERKEDIPLLAGYFLALYTQKNNKNVTGFSAEAMQLLHDYNWPGNIRELSNVIHRTVVLCESSIIQKEDLEIHDNTASDNSLPELIEDGFDLENQLTKVECFYIKEALAKTNGNLTQAAKLLNLSFRSLRYKVKKYGLKL
ncbi:sigma-54-dependent transcriptional regulator [Candidatus Uabimicrobium sp. HlEnr_7]|uniref:sigma-54-dependent transcriptional regulator n=1 Tax=Candidatus Uabimicrobium helgolandensis TaxID=3095367 RepID=UPI0035589BF4